MDFKYVHRITEDDFNILFNHDSRYLEFLPKKYIKKHHVDIYMKSNNAKINILQYEFIDDHIDNKNTLLSNITQELFDNMTDEEIVKYYKRIPQKYITQRMTDIYVKNVNELSLFNIPPNHINQHIVNKYILNPMFKPLDIPDIFMDKYIIDEYMKTKFWNLSYIQPLFITPKIVENYMEEEHWDIIHIPYEYRNKEVYKRYMSKNDSDLTRVPLYMVTRDIVIQHIKNGISIRSIPFKFIVDDIFELYVKSGGNYILLDNDLVNLSNNIILKYADIISWLFCEQSIKFITLEFILKYLTNPNCNFTGILPYAYRYLDKFKTKTNDELDNMLLKLYMKSKTWDALYIPRNLLSNEIIFEYLKLPHFKLEHIPTVLITREIVDIAVNNHKIPINTIPIHLRDSYVVFKSEMKYTCVICYSYYDETMTANMSCNRHGYCINCYEVYKNDNVLSCPVCRHITINKL